MIKNHRYLYLHFFKPSHFFTLVGVLHRLRSSAAPSELNEDSDTPKEGGTETETEDGGDDDAAGEGVEYDEAEDGYGAEDFILPPSLSTLPDYPPLSPSRLRDNNASINTAQQEQQQQLEQQAYGYSNFHSPAALKRIQNLTQHHERSSAPFLAPHRPFPSSSKPSVHVPIGSDPYAELSLRGVLETMEDSNSNSNSNQLSKERDLNSNSSLGPLSPHARNSAPSSLPPTHDMSSSI